MPYALAAPPVAPAVHSHWFGSARHGVAPRVVRVWLPPQAVEAGRRFPVLWLQDGQNLFDPDGAAFGRAWQVGETAARLLRRGTIAPVILVGVDHGGSHRLGEYTPVPFGGRGGQAPKLAQFLLDVVLPFVAAHYPVAGGPANTAIGGSSLGGLFALWFALRRPDVFGHVAALSPTVWWGNGLLLRAIAGMGEPPPLRIWLDVGKREAPPLRQQVRALYDLLRSRGLPVHRDARRSSLRFLEAPRAGHDEASWGRRFDRVLRFLFPPPATSRTGSRARKSRLPPSPPGPAS